MSSTLLSTTLFLLVTRKALSQTVQNAWVFPGLPDYSTTVFEGSNYTVQWDTDLQGAFSQFCSECDTSNVDLWATGNTDDSIIYIVQRGVDVADTTSLNWTVNVPESSLSTTQWILRFVPSGSAPGTGVGEISSPRLYIRPAASNPNATSSSSSTTTAPTTTSIAPVTTTAAASSGLSTGAKAGIGIGAAIGGVLLIAGIAGAIFFLKRKKSQPPRSPTFAAEQATSLGGAGKATSFNDAGITTSEPPMYEAKKEQYSDDGAAAELPTKASPTQPAELDTHIPTGELDATPYQAPAVELPADTTRRP